MILNQLENNGSECFNVFTLHPPCIHIKIILKERNVTFQRYESEGIEISDF